MEVIELVGWIATAIALVGVWLNNRRRRACFLFWLASNALSLIVHLVAGIWSLSARDAAFFILAIDGLIRWRRDR